MPKIALISDIHANFHALRAVLDEIAAMGIEQIVSLGDIVGYGPHPAECVKRMRETGGLSVLGNHDFYTLLARKKRDFLPTDAESLTNPVWAGIRHAVHHLDADAFEWLGSLPKVIEIPGAIVTHAALHEPDRWPYLLNERDAQPTLDLLAKTPFRIVFVGHTHRQDWFSMPGHSRPMPIEADSMFQLQEDSLCAVVVGSVGQPRSGDYRAGWTIWDSDARSFEFRRTDYPCRETAHAILDAGLPESSARRLLGNS